MSETNKYNATKNLMVIRDIAVLFSRILKPLCVGCETFTLVPPGGAIKNNTAELLQHKLLMN